MKRFGKDFRYTVSHELAWVLKEGKDSIDTSYCHPYTGSPCEGKILFLFRLHPPNSLLRFVCFISCLTLSFLPLPLSLFLLLSMKDSFSSFFLPIEFFSPKTPQLAGIRNLCHWLPILQSSQKDVTCYHVLPFTDFLLWYSFISSTLSLIGFGPSSSSPSPSCSLVSTSHSSCLQSYKSLFHVHESRSTLSFFFLFDQRRCSGLSFRLLSNSISDRTSFSFPSHLLVHRFLSFLSFSLFSTRTFTHIQDTGIFLKRRNGLNRSSRQG